MRILVCSNYFDTCVNGTVFIPHWLLKINASTPEHQIVVVTPDVAQSSENVIKIPFDYPRPLLPFTVFLYNFAYFKAARRLRRQFDYDIVIFNMGIGGILTRLMLPKRVLVLGFQHDYNNFSPERSQFSSFRRFLFAYIQHFLEKIAFRFLDYTVCPSNFLRQKILATGAPFPQKITVIHPAIDVQSIKFVNEKAFESPVKIVFVKWNYRIGGLGVLLEALKLLDNWSFQLSIIGPDAENQQAIEAFCAGLPHVQLRFWGRRPSEEVHNALNDHDILCIPSEKEGLGLANVEGLAHGISVVTTNVGGIPEVMDGGRNGWMVEPGDSLALAEALKECIETPPEVRAEISRRGRAYVEEHFDYRKMLVKLLEFLKKHDKT